MDTRKGSIRVVMLPWLAHGHISPFLELAKALAERNFVTYICSSPINLNPIKQTLTPKHSISIKLVELQIPATPQLPPRYHTTNGLPPHLMGHLKRALDSARPAFSVILGNLEPDLVLYDFLHPWAPEEAALRGIPAVVFFSTGAAAFSFIMHHSFGPRAEYPFPGIFIRENEYENFSRLVGPSAGGGDGTEDHVRVRNCITRSSDVILIKTFRELEGKYVDFLSELTGKKIVPVGPLVSSNNSNNNNNVLEDEKYDHIIEWLDRKDRRSTIFVSFGSEYFLSKNEIEEIAYGLEMSNVNFIWVLRFPDLGDEKKIKIDKKLPREFLERVRERGMVLEGWAPQRRILLHPSVGGFLSHCGWSSVMEGMFSGVPIAAAPMHLDQPLNARLVAEVGVGEEAVRGGDGRIERDEVARVVRKVVVEGEEMRRRAVEISERMREKGEEEIDGVVEELATLCKRGERFNGLGSQSSTKRLNMMNIIMENRQERMLSENA